MMLLVQNGSAGGNMTDTENKSATCVTLRPVVHNTGMNNNSIPGTGD